MQIKTSFPREVREIRHTWIPMSDGVALSARIWLPEDAGGDRVPAILEYIPYRKDDATAVRDAGIHPYFAGHGYASARVDLRGSGDSEGVLRDEYLPQEQEDGARGDPLACSAALVDGRGRHDRQVLGRLQRAPDRGARPGGAEGGGQRLLDGRPVRATTSTTSAAACSASYMLSWASTMLAFNARPPDPAVVGRTLARRCGSSDSSRRRPSSRSGSGTSGATPTGSRGPFARTSRPSAAPSTWSEAGQTATRAPSSASLPAIPVPQGPGRPLGSPLSSRRHPWACDRVLAGMPSLVGPLAEGQ